MVVLRSTRIRSYFSSVETRVRFCVSKIEEIGLVLGRFFLEVILTGIPKPAESLDYGSCSVVDYVNFENFME